ncbi:ribonuclease I [Mangrovicoccus sp. HB161399]|uniref:ribonuclease T2 family protein n=1 Tax=Mangrovicoccus sp. HB161399 TaxID=2720392 RepID=UPI0015528AC8|nr:ribonuclease I [Mangrovicoccus sp. HB161399]
MTRAFLLSAVLAVLSGQAPAEIRMEGRFTAADSCEATKKLRSDNPGNVRLAPGTVYELLAGNARPPSHYRIKVPGAPVTDSRWVPIGCGSIGAGQPPAVAASGGIENLLAASWQPGFCATSAGEGKTECRTQAPDRADATQFSLHGLWPDDLDDSRIFPCFCGDGVPDDCSGRGPRRESPRLSAAVRARLGLLMPGTMSGLEDHEWTKHGTCYEMDLAGPDAGSDADEYFSEAMLLMDQLNDGPVRDLFAANAGRQLEFAAVSAAFDSAYGPGAGKRVTMKCAGTAQGKVITELWISLGAPVSADSELGALMSAAPPRVQDCRGGLVAQVR